MCQLLASVSERLGPLQALYPMLPQQLLAIGKLRVPAASAKRMTGLSWLGSFFARWAQAALALSDGSYFFRWMAFWVWQETVPPGENDIRGARCPQ